MSSTGETQPGAGVLRLTIVHLTDMHLLCDVEGRSTDFDQLRRIGKLARMAGGRSARVRKQLRLGCGVQGSPQWAALPGALAQVVAAERDAARQVQAPDSGSPAPVTVVQTGDVTTFGYDVTQPGGPSFPEFGFLQRALWPKLLREGAAACVDVYGNHDKGLSR